MEHEGMFKDIQHQYRHAAGGMPLVMAGGLPAWETSGRVYDWIEAIHITDLGQRLHDGDGFTLVDVRSKGEFESGHLRTAVHVYVGDLPSKLEQIPRRRPITTFCESGQRATIAAVFLRRRGMQPVEVCLGSMSACSHVECQAMIGG
jgi:hydroxyacylglutathione hydrolase